MLKNISVNRLTYSAGQDVEKVGKTLWLVRYANRWGVFSALVLRRIHWANVTFITTNWTWLWLTALSFLLSLTSETMSHLFIGNILASPKIHHKLNLPANRTLYVELLFCICFSLLSDPANSNHHVHAAFLPAEEGVQVMPNFSLGYATLQA